MILSGKIAILAGKWVVAYNGCVGDPGFQLEDRPDRPAYCDLGDSWGIAGG